MGNLTSYELKLFSLYGDEVDFFSIAAGIFTVCINGCLESNNWFARSYSIADLLRYLQEPALGETMKATKTRQLGCPPARPYRSSSQHDLSILTIRCRVESREMRRKRVYR